MFDPSLPKVDMHRHALTQLTLSIFRFEVKTVYMDNVPVDTDGSDVSKMESEISLATGCDRATGCKQVLSAVTWMLNSQSITHLIGSGCTCVNVCCLLWKLNDHNLMQNYEFVSGLLACDQQLCIWNKSFQPKHPGVHEGIEFHHSSCEETSVTVFLTGLVDSYPVQTCTKM